MTKPLWIFVAGPPRSGSSTQYEITRTIAEDTDSGIGIGYHTEEKLREYDNSKHDMIICKVFAYLPEYYYDTHDNLKAKESYGKIIANEDRLKTVVTVRNPLDIVTSMKKRAGDNWNMKETLKDLPRWLNDAIKWIDLGPKITYYSRFEDYIKNLPTETLNIANHLGIELPDKGHHRIGNLFRIEKIQERKGKQHNPPPENERRHLPSVPGIVFGTSGQWSTWLTHPEQKAVIEISKEFMERFGYKVE